MTGNDLWHILDPFDTAEHERDEYLSKLKYCLTAGETTARLVEEAQAETVRLREALERISRIGVESPQFQLPGAIAHAALEQPRA